MNIACLHHGIIYYIAILEIRDKRRKIKVKKGGIKLMDLIPQTGVLSPGLLQLLLVRL